MADAPVVRERALSERGPFLDPQHVTHQQPVKQHLRHLDINERERTKIDKEGLITLKVNLSCLFSKEGVGVAKMQGPMDYIKVFELHVSTAAPLPKHVTKDLKPMMLMIEKVSRLPTTPISHKELRERCACSMRKGGLIEL